RPPLDLCLLTSTAEGPLQGRFVDGTTTTTDEQAPVGAVAALVLPIVPKAMQKWCREGDGACLVPLSVLDPHDTAIADDVSNLELEAFGDPEAKGVEGRERGAAHRIANEREDPAYLV